jgi:hypothetical protein
VCAVPVEFREGASPAEVHEAVRRILAEDAHWGVWYLGLARAKLGTAALRGAMHAYYARPRHAWMGTFSNLGDHSLQGVEPKYFYVGAPPPTVTHPITAAVMGWGGRLSLTVQAHAAVSEEPDAAMGWARRWKELALEG